jgi:hypothetical protein
MLEDDWAKIFDGCCTSRQQLICMHVTWNKVLINSPHPHLSFYQHERAARAIENYVLGAFTVSWSLSLHALLVGYADSTMSIEVICILQGVDELENIR